MIRTFPMLLALLAALALGAVGCSKNKQAKSGEDTPSKKTLAAKDKSPDADAGDKSSGGGSATPGEKPKPADAGIAGAAKVAKFLTVKPGDSVDDLKSKLGRPTNQFSDANGDALMWAQDGRLLTVKAKDGKVIVMAIAGGQVPDSEDLSPKFDQIKKDMAEDQAVKLMNAAPTAVTREKGVSNYVWVDRSAHYQIHCKDGKVAETMTFATGGKPGEASGS